MTTPKRPKRKTFLSLIPHLTAEQIAEREQREIKFQLEHGTLRILHDLRARTTDSEAIARLDAGIRDREVSARRQALMDSGLQIPASDIGAIAEGRGIDDTPAIEHVRHWYTRWHEQTGDDRRPWPVLAGPPGVGKTFAVAWVLAERGIRAALAESREIAERGAVKPVRASRLVDLMFPGYDDPSHGHVETRALAVLEDLGTESGEKRFASALGEFFEDRFDRPTIVTTNLAPTDLRERYGARLVDRWRHCAVVVELDGKSLRRQDGGL